jgi:hypothetical protein
MLAEVRRQAGGLPVEMALLASCLLAALSSSAGGIRALGGRGEGDREWFLTRFGEDGLTNADREHNVYFTDEELDGKAGERASVGEDPGARGSSNLRQAFDFEAFKKKLDKVEKVMQVRRFIL